MTLPVSDLEPGSETQVNTYFTDDQAGPAIAALGDGGFVVVWTDSVQDGSVAGVYGQIYDADGDPVGGEFRVNTTTTDGQGLAKVTTLADGGFIVTWQSAQQDGDSFGIYAQRYDATGTVSGSEVAINTETAGAQDLAAIAGLADGGYVIVWESANQDGDGLGVYLQQYDADGIAVGSETLVNTATTGGQSQPAIAALGDGGYVIAWTDQDGLLSGVSLQRYDAYGTPVGTEARVNTYTTSAQNDPSIAALADGGYIVTWSSFGEDTSGYGIYAQRFDSNGDPVNGEFLVNSETAGLQYDSEVAGLSDGGYVITWSSNGQDGGGYGVYSQRYDSADGVVGTETLVNTFTVTNQLFPMVEALADGGYLVGWTSDVQDGDGYGVFMKRWTVADTVGTNVGEIMDGTGAAVHMLGGDGDDTYIVDSLDDTVTELPGEGNDLVDAFVSFTLSANVESLILDGFDDIDGTGNSDSNAIIGNSGDNRLDGGGGADIMQGGDGDDTYVIDDVGDVYIEVDGEGYDEIDIGWSFTLTEGGPFEDLRLTGSNNIDGTGNSDDNYLTGNDGNNVLLGLDGDDAIDGGLGDDTMAGGDGDDTYAVDSAGDVVIETDDQGLDIVFSTISYTLGAHIDGVFLDPTSTDDLNLTGNRLDNILSGNDGDNVLNGGGGDDLMFGFGGDDVYYVNSIYDEVSEELICGCDAGGTDKVISTVDFYMPDYVENLTLSGTDDLYGIGNDEDNNIRGNSGDNTLDGDEGADIVNGGLGADTMYGGADDDTYYVDDADDETIEDFFPGSDDGGHDKVFASVSWTLNIYTEDLTLTGNDNIDGTGNDDDNVMRGNSGNNVLDGGIGADTMTGGLGDDSYYVDDLDDRVAEQAAGGTDTVFSYVSYTLRSQVENLELLGTDSLNGTGNDLTNILTGNAGNNILNGRGGADTLIGGDGNDSYFVDDADDTTTEVSGEGTDTVRSTVTYSLGDNIELLYLIGAGTIDGTGNELANTIIGTTGNNILTGGLGNDTLNGNVGDDTLIGGTGDDRYYVDSDDDSVTEALGEGVDQVYSSVTYSLGDNIETLVLTGSLAIDGTGNDLANTITGNTGNNILTGGLGNDVLNGSVGDDTMVGGAGNDTYFVDSGADTITEVLGGGIDQISVGFSYSLDTYIEALVLTGTLAIDGTGNGLDNTLRGNAEANRLSGLSGADTLFGGAGADDFVFLAAGANGVDRISDFTSGIDHLAFSTADYGFANGHSLDGTELTFGRYATGSHAQFIFNAHNRALYWDPDGVGGTNEIAIAILSGVTTLQASDFVFS